MREHVFRAPNNVLAHGLFRRFGLPVPDSFQKNDMLVGGRLIVMGGGVFSAPDAGAVPQLQQIRRQLMIVRRQPDDFFFFFTITHDIERGLTMGIFSK